MEISKKIIHIKNFNGWHNYPDILKLAKIIVIAGTTFMYNDELNAYYPTQGKQLGSDIPVRDYPFEDFSYLLGKYPLDMRCDIRIFERITDTGDANLLLLLRDHIVIESLIDYSRMITELEKCSLIKTKK